MNNVSFTFSVLTYDHICAVKVQIWPNMLDPCFSDVPSVLLIWSFTVLSFFIYLRNMKHSWTPKDLFVLSLIKLELYDCRNRVNLMYPLESHISFTTSVVPKISLLPFESTYFKVVSRQEPRRPSSVPLPILPVCKIVLPVILLQVPQVTQRCWPSESDVLCSP